MNYVRACPPHTWQAFVLTAIEGKSGDAVAKLLDMKIGTVWVARSKVKKMLQDEVLKIEMDESMDDSRESLS